MASQGQILPLLSTTTPLLATQAWTSIPFLAAAWASLNVIVTSDVAGSLLVKWSGDNGTTYAYTEAYTIVGGVPQSIALTTLCQNVQMVYTNGAVNQGDFKLYTFGSSSNSVVSITQNLPPIEISITGPNSVTVNSLPAPVITRTFIPLQTLSFNQGDSADDVGPTAFSSELPESYFVKPIVTTHGSMGATAGRLWGVTGNMFYLSSATASSTVNDGPIITSNAMTPGSDTIVVEFSASFFDQSLPQSSTDYSNDSIGYGLQYPGSTAIWSGITISSVTPYVWENIYGRKALITWQKGVPTTILQKDWDDPANIIEWTDANAFRFLIQPYSILFQFRYTWANEGMAWRTMHTIQLPALSKMTSKSGNMIMRNIKINTAANPAGVGCYYFNTYVSAFPPITSYQALDISPSISTTETFMCYLVSEYLYDARVNDVTARDFTMSVTNLSTSGLLTIRIYRTTSFTGGTGVSTPAGSVLTYYTGGSPAGATLIRSFNFPLGSTKDVPLSGLVLDPGENYYITGQLNTGSSSVAWMGLNWNEYH